MTGRLDVLAAAVVKNYLERGRTAALAESCTGGMIASAVTDIAGASEIFLGSAVTYANSAKENILGVSPETLASDGAVSEKCAKEMAEGARRIFGADTAVSVTGIAGPGGGSPQKPVGTVWFGYSSEKEACAFCKIFEGDRDEVRRQTAELALITLLEKLDSGTPQKEGRE